MRWKGGDVLGMRHAEVDPFERLNTGLPVGTFTVTPRLKQRRAPRKEHERKESRRDRAKDEDFPRARRQAGSYPSDRAWLTRGEGAISRYFRFEIQVKLEDNEFIGGRVKGHTNWKNHRGGEQQVSHRSQGRCSKGSRNHSLGGSLNE